MCNCSLQCSLRSGGNDYDVSWIGNLGDAQNPCRMLFVDIQCLIVHITNQLFECKCFGVISAIFELQFTNQSWESCLELLQRNSTWPFVELLNFPRGTIDLHGVYEHWGHSLQWNIRWWCESRCGNMHTPLMNPSKWTLMYRWCSVTWTWIPGRNYTGWRWCYRHLMVPSWRLWA